MRTLRDAFIETVGFIGLAGIASFVIGSLVSDKYSKIQEGHVFSSSTAQLNRFEKL